MKLKNIIPFILVTLILSLNSCYDDKMEWGKDPSHGEVTTSELPLALQEAIGRYKALNTYTNITLGAGIDFNLYMTDEAYRNIVNENFDQVTAGNEMKQSSLMNNNGELNFTRIDDQLAELERAGLKIYGHTLVWHNQQRASYLNSLIAPTIVPGTPGSSLVDGSFEDGMGGWEAAYYKENYSIVTTDAIDGTHALQVIIPSDATGGKYDGHGQLNSPDFPIISGHHYQVSFWIKGSVPGQVAIDFPNANLGNQYPWVDGAEFAPVGTSWTQVVYNTTTVGNDAMIATTDGNTHVRLLLASVPDVTYLIDVIEIVDLDAEVDGNLLPEGGFESGDLEADGWQAKNPGAGIEITTEEVRTGTYAVKLTAGASSSNDWDLQLGAPPITITSGNQYEISFYIKSDVAGKGRLSFGSSMSDNYPWINGAREFTTGADWTRVVYNPETIGSDWVSKAGTLTIDFDLGLSPDVTYYIDDVTVLDVTPAAKSSVLRAGPTVIDKTPEEKFEILEPVFVKYITDVATHFKGKVDAWEVVNEPMNDNGTLREGVEDQLATDVFYWQYYLGKDYAVTAFKTAKAADPDAKLFINDFNLESANGAKLDGLIEYVKYIEEKGGKVDGIGTQLHMNINWSDKEGIKTMFEKLAATGKLIKVTEMDIAISNESGHGTGPASSVSPTADQFAQQAELYRYVADMYTRIIPANQQAGITVWGISDREDEHLYWLKNDMPNFWDANLQRKHAYKGFADGLAGRDVSEDFPGDLIIE